MKKETRLKILLFLISSVIIGIYSIHITKRDNERFEKLKAEYPDVTIEDQFWGYVYDIDHSKVTRPGPDLMRLSIENSSKKCIYAYSDEYGNDLVDVIKLRSYLVKKANSDTIYVYNFNNIDTTVNALKIR